MGGGSGESVDADNNIHGAQNATLRTVAVRGSLAIRSIYLLIFPTVDIFISFFLGGKICFVVEILVLVSCFPVCSGLADSNRPLKDYRLIRLQWNDHQRTPMSLLGVDSK